MRTKILMTGLAATLCAFFPHVGMAAATANSAPITISLPVSSATCTVNNSNTSIPMPTASVGQTVASYQALYLPTPPAVDPASVNVRTSTTLNQTAIISCNTANTPITSFLVKPGPSAFYGTPTPNANQFLVDASSPPVKAAGGAADIMLVFTEQVSVNGSAMPFLYRNPSTFATVPYTTQFSTGNLSTGATPTSTATVVWRPLFYTGVNSQDKFTAPTGGNYNGSFQIVVDY